MTGQPEAITEAELAAAFAERLRRCGGTHLIVANLPEAAADFFELARSLREPGYEPGVLVVDDVGDVYRRCNEMARDMPWLGFGGHLHAEDAPVRPLRRLIPEEPAPLPDPKITCAACRHVAPSMAEVAWQPDWKQWRCTDPAACHKRQQEAGMEGDVR